MDSIALIFSLISKFHKIYLSLLALKSDRVDGIVDVILFIQIRYHKENNTVGYSFLCLRVTINTWFTFFIDSATRHDLTKK